MKLKEKIKSEKGAALIVEAAVVFPVVIFVVMLLLVLGNFYFQQSRVEQLVIRAADKMDQYFTDPVYHNGAPTAGTDIKPYRYLSGGEFAEKEAKNFLQTELGKLGTGFFPNMEVKVIKITCDLKNIFIMQDGKITVDYTVWLPVGFFGMEENRRCSCSVDYALLAPEEMIRNIDMIDDYYTKTGLKEKIEGKFEEWKSSLDNFR